MAMKDTARITQRSFVSPDDRTTGGQLASAIAEARQEVGISITGPGFLTAQASTACF